MALVIEIKVTPSAGRQQLSIDKSGALKCLLKSPPEKGKANAELLKLLSKLLGLPQQKLVILTGETTRKKRIKIEADMTFEQFCEKVGLQVQRTIN